MFEGREGGVDRDSLIEQAGSSNKGWLGRAVSVDVAIFEEFEAGDSIVGGVKFIQ